MPLSIRSPWRAAAVLPLLAVAACSDPVRPVALKRAGPAAPLLLALRCEASVATRAVACAEPGSSGADGMSSIIVGGQGSYVKLTSSNIAVVADTFAFDVTVQNLVHQAFGTTDTDVESPARDAGGVRVFLAAGPTSSGAGTVSVENATGVGTFLGAGEPYFQYDTVLASSETTDPLRWKMRFSPEVTNFTFTVYVSTAVAFPNGYVDEHAHVLLMNPNESLTLNGTVRNAVGVPLGGSITFTSGNPGLASIAGSTITAGSTVGFTTLAFDAGGRPGYGPAWVAVCPSQTVVDGSEVAGTISATDCHAMVHPDDGFAPSSNHYVDQYRITLTAGQQLEASLDNGSADGLSGLDTYAVLTDLEGNFITANDDDAAGVLGFGSRLNYTATRTGVYVIHATTFPVGDDPDGNGQGPYTLRVTVH